MSRDANQREEDELKLAVKDRDVNLLGKLLNKGVFFGSVTNTLSKEDRGWAKKEISRSKNTFGPMASVHFNWSC